jgi:hypothetical protein
LFLVLKTGSMEATTLVRRLWFSRQGCYALTRWPLSSARPSMRQVSKYLSRDVPLPELAPTHRSFESLALMQNEGFDSYVMSYPSSMATMTTMSSPSGEVIT